MNLDYFFYAFIDPRLFWSIFIVFLVFVYFRKKHSFWSLQGIPGPRPLPIFGNSLYYFSRSMKEGDADLIRQYGPLVGTYESTTPVLILGDLEIIKAVLIKNFSSFTDNYQYHGHRSLRKMVLQEGGNTWRRSRSILTPTFTSGKMKAMLPLIVDCVTSLEKSFDRQIDKSVSKKKATIDAKYHFTRLTIDVIAKVAFATEINAHDREDDLFVNHALSLFVFPNWKQILGTLMPNQFKKMINFSLFNLSHTDYLLEVCQAMIRQKRQEKEKGQSRQYLDFLDLLLEAADDEGHGLTDDEIFGNCFLILIAGFETTATLMTMVSYLLSTCPDVQEKLYQEVKDCYEKNGNRLDYEAVANLTYLSATLDETLRIYPSVVRFDRVASEDITLENGVFIKKGTIMRFPVYQIHHDDKLYPEPEQFRPERFLPENKDQLIPYSYIPFVQGPRNCIGMRFAQLESKHATANLVLKYKFSRPNPDVGKLEYGSWLVLAPENVKVCIEKRDN